MQCAFGHRHLHRGAGVAQAPPQSGRFVGVDAAAHPEQDLAPPELVAGLDHVRKPLRADEATAYPNECRRPTAPDRAPRCNTSIAGGRGETNAALLSACPCGWRPPAKPLLQESTMHIRDWPPGERPREKLLKRGATVLSDAELLAIFLGSGLRGLDAVATARRLLAEHGPLRRLLEHRPPDRKSTRLNSVT